MSVGTGGTMRSVRGSRIRVWQRRLVPLAVAAALGPEFGHAAPSGAVVVNGQVGFSQQGKQLTITNTPGAIINWRSFSIARDETTRFIQQSAASTVLNRVTGVDPSQILGALQSNGRVFLINPNGILFGAGAQIDTAGLVASTLSLSNQDFLAGRLRFTDTPGAGNLRNQGAINASAGPVYLIASNVENSGVITAPGGDIILAAGKTVQLVDPQSPDVRIEITASGNEAVNLGKLIADRGHVGIYAGMIRNSGTIRANSAALNEKGEVVLMAKKDITLDKSSVITANGPQGGKVTIQAEEGSATIAGTIEAKGSPLSPAEQGDGVPGKGGTIAIAGAQGVNVQSGARISADGATGGSVSLTSSAGSVTIAAPVTANATSGRAGDIAVRAASVNLASGAQLSASGGQSGGSVTVQGATSVTTDIGSVVQATGATGGAIAVQSEQGSINVQGSLEATGTEGSGGSVTVTARGDITLDVGSRISVGGGLGGEVRVESTAGTLTASGLINALGGNGPGGKIYLLAPRVALIRRALIDVSGQNGGGTILVGGDYQGRNTYVQNAFWTYVGEDATLRADAIIVGNGGKVIVWSDDATFVHGAISARGGVQSGGGGFVETSSKGMLRITRAPDVSAPAGQGGTWLLDPYNITITTVDTTIVDVDAGADFDFRGTASSSTIAAATIEAALNLGSNVIVDTSGGGGDAGNIDVN